VHNPECVVVVEPGDSLFLIAERIADEIVDIDTLAGENFLSDADVIHPGEYLDVCVDNEVDDVTGEQRPNPAIVQAERRGSVEVQQQKLNELFASLGSPELLVDGISGPLTRQMLCAARLGLGLPTSTADMEAGSEEEATLLAAERIVVPWNEAVQADRWALVDRTCQIMFVSQGTEQVTFVFPVSTGEAEHETDLQTRARAFRYDPAVENGGWHNSTTYPVPADNALNGNMYRPIYFNNGEAIHGASVVPPNPAARAACDCTFSTRTLSCRGSDSPTPVLRSGGRPRSTSPSPCRATTPAEPRCAAPAAAVGSGAHPPRHRRRWRDATPGHPPSSVPSGR
jgi:hypothetical protein